MSELPPHRLRELERFFLDYKVLENKTVNLGHLHGRAEAEGVILAAMRLYQATFGPAA